MTYTKEDKKRYLILQCRYYKGESEPPKTLPEGYALMWDYESRWVDWTLNEDKMVNHFENDIRDLHLETKEGDKTPLTLKALLCNRYLHWGGYAPLEEELKNFEKWYVDFYQMWKTNREHRADKRKPDLIAKCKYYKGENDNPWEYCYSPVLEYRKSIWCIEKEWSDAMAESYLCIQSSTKLIKDFVLEEFFKAKGLALSLLNLIVAKQKEKAEERKEHFGPAEAIKTVEKYEKLAPLANDHRKYFAFYLGEEEDPEYDYSDDKEYIRFGYSQEKLQNRRKMVMQDFNSMDFQFKYRGKEGIWGWYADPKFPKEQKEIVFFACCNWGCWCPYSDVDKLAEEYLQYHYPGGERPVFSDRMYHKAALTAIEDEEYYQTVRKCGTYQGKRAYEPIFKDEYKKEPPKIGLPLVILVDDEGNVEKIRDFLSFDIYNEIRKNSKNQKS